MLNFMKRMWGRAVAVVKQAVAITVKMAVAGKEAGMIGLGALMSMAIMAYVVMLFIINFTPQMETDVSSANITNTFTSSMVDMSVWLVPVILIALVFIGLSRRIKGGSTKGE